MKPAVLAFAMMPRIYGGDPSTGRRVGRNGGWKITLDYIIMIYRYIDIDIDIYIYIFKYRYRYIYIYTLLDTIEQLEGNGPARDM